MNCVTPSKEDSITDTRESRSAYRRNIRAPSFELISRAVHRSTSTLVAWSTGWYGRLSAGLEPFIGKDTNEAYELLGRTTAH